MSERGIAEILTNDDYSEPEGSDLTMITNRGYTRNKLDYDVSFSMNTSIKNAVNNHSPQSIRVVRCLLMVVLCTAIPVTMSAQGSYDKEEILVARERDKTRKARHERISKMSFEVAVSSSEGFDVFPGASLVWGKGFYDGLAKVTVKYKAGYIDRAGKLVIKPTLIDGGHFSEGLAPFESQNGKWGFINKRGSIVIKPTFDWALSFAEGLALIQKDEKWGFIDKTGTVIIEPKYDEAESFSEGVAAVAIYDNEYVWPSNSRPNGKMVWFFIDSAGKNSLGASFDGISRSFDHGMALVSKNIGYKNGVLSESYFIGKDGGKLWTLDSWYVSWFSDDLIVVAAGKNDEGRSMFSFRDRDGKFLTDKVFDNISEFSQGLAPASVDGKYGYINRNGDFVIQPQYDGASTFSEGLASVQMTGSKKKYIDRSGRVVINTDCDWADRFRDGIALVAGCSRKSFDRESGYIDMTGKYVWKPTK